MCEYVLPDALIAPPPPLEPQRFKNLISSISGARPFESVEMSEREFIDMGNTVIISYKATARHPRFRRSYMAQCMTTYVSHDDGWKIASHNHVRL